jgi:carboxymethylenebutenolidase
MPSTFVDLATRDGTCRTEIIAPEGEGPWPAILLCYDAGGPRAAMTAMAERIAHGGYLVAIPDFYHRAGSIVDILPPDVPRDPAQLIPLLRPGELFQKWMSTFYLPALDYEHLRVDAGAVLDHLATRPDVTGGVGTTGYCMGGNISVRIATLFGDRIAVTAAFHAGGLVTPAPDSPHLRAAEIKSRVYVAGAIEDPWFTDDMRHQLEAALHDARVEHTIETYPARHGFAVPDNPTYHPAQSDRHFKMLEQLYAPLAAHRPGH